jgi:hypothetical protein
VADWGGGSREGVVRWVGGVGGGGKVVRVGGLRAASAVGLQFVAMGDRKGKRGWGRRREGGHPEPQPGGTSYC